MSAAVDYPMLKRRADGGFSPEARNALAEIDTLRAEVARLKARLADAHEADAALHIHITNGGRI